MFQLISDSFIQMALCACLLASFASGPIGTFVVVKRIVFIAGSISHSILGGVGLCLWLQRSQGIQWLDPMIGAFGAAIASALLIGWIHLRYRQREDAVIAAIWSTGMSIGVVFFSITPGNSGELSNFLFGNILWIRGADLALLAGLDALLLSILALNFRKFLAICFDEDQSLLQGLAVQRLYLILLCIVAVTIVLLIQIIGTILVLALLTIPATLAALFTRSLPSMMLLATTLSCLFCTLGLGASYALNWPPGATISLLAATLYLFALLSKRKKLNSPSLLTKGLGIE